MERIWMWVLASALLTTACGESGDGVTDEESEASASSCTAKCDAVDDELVAITDELWGGCAVETGPGGPQLDCFSFKDGIVVPRDLFVSVDSDDGAFSASATAPPGRPVESIVIPQEAFPVEVRAVMTFDEERTRVRGIGSPAISKVFRWNGPADVRPFEFEAPFEIWPMQVVWTGYGGDPVTFVSAAFYVDGYGTGEGDATTLEVLPLLPLDPGNIKTTYVPVPHGASLQGVFVSGDEQSAPITFDGPGRWMVDLDEARRPNSSEEELYFEYVLPEAGEPSGTFPNSFEAEFIVSGRNDYHPDTLKLRGAPALELVDLFEAMHQRDPADLIERTDVESTDGTAVLYRVPDAECTVDDTGARCRIAELDWAGLEQTDTTTTISMSGGFAPEAIGGYVDFLASNGRPDFVERFDCQLGHNLNTCAFSYPR